jgi:hypothetical protein
VFSAACGRSLTFSARRNEQHQPAARRSEQRKPAARRSEQRTPAARHSNQLVSTCAALINLFCKAVRKITFVHKDESEPAAVGVATSPHGQLGQQLLCQRTVSVPGSRAPVRHPRLPP